MDGCGISLACKWVRYLFLILVSRVIIELTLFSLYQEKSLYTANNNSVGNYLILVYHLALGYPAMALSGGELVYILASRSEQAFISKRHFSILYCLVVGSLL